VQIKDRIKDVIKTGGEWVSSLDLENLISTHANINAVAVVGVPDEQWDERPCAMVVLNNDSDDFSVKVLENHLHQYVLSGQINKWAIPSSIVIVEEIPKTSVGKIDKKLIRSQLTN
jgi:fatty-acyl-CoA synthase